LPVGGGGAARPALVKKQDPVIAQGPVQPGVPPDRPLRAEARAALQEEQPGQSGAGLAGRDDLPGEQLDLPAGRIGVIERDGEGQVGEHGARLAVRNHDWHRNGTLRLISRTGAEDGRHGDQ
jgi:hypothetical protein